MIDYAVCCCQGQRSYNEDRVGISTEQGDCATFVLADGLGGHGMGDIASSLAVECSLSCAEDTGNKGNALLCNCFERAQSSILKKQNELDAGQKMKTTMVLLRIEKNMAYFGYIGDSRLYHFSSRGWKRLTMDHSVPQLLVSTGEIKESEIRHHPDRNKLLRVLGVEWETPRYSINPKPVPVKRGDGFLLCSDGFWEYILEEEMTGFYKKEQNAQHWLEKMKELVEKRGEAAQENADNFSAIAIRIV